MLSRELRWLLPQVAAQLALRHPGCVLEDVDGHAVLTIDQGVTEDARRQVFRFLAANRYDDVRLADDGPRAELPADFHQYRRGNHHLTDALASFR